MVLLAQASEVTRETFWQISPGGRVVFYYLAAMAGLSFLYGFYRRVERYRSGSVDPIDRLDDLPRRVLAGTKNIGSNATLFDGDRVAGVMHTFVFWGFLTLLTGTIVLGFEMDVWVWLLGRNGFFYGDFYRSYSLLMDVMGLVFVFGLALAIVKRYGFRNDRLRGTYTGLEDDLFVWSLFVLGVGGFLQEGVRIVGTGMLAFERVSVVGWGLATVFSGLGLDPGPAAMLYRLLWWSHAGLALAFVAMIPYGKPLHFLTSFANVITRDSKAGKRLPGVPEDADTADIGTGTIESFSWKQLLDHDACTKCGRCSSVCPATAAGRPLDPQDVILDLRTYGRERQAGDTESVPIVSNSGESVIEPTTLESCMACLACVEACPVEIDHVTQFTGMNRRLVESGQVDRTVQEGLMALFRQGNAYGEPEHSRGDWTEPLPFEVPDARETEVEYLWYVGDDASFDERNKRVARSLARVFDAAGVSYGILYEDERNAGNDVRRVGEEGLFETLATENVEAFDSVTYDTLVTTDPHAYNTFRNEYDQVGWDRCGDVKHYTQVLQELLASGALPGPTTDTGETVTFHDPCHLGRYNGEYEAPREILTSMGAELTEMPRNRSRATCCGGGGGGRWLDPDETTKPAENRLHEALKGTPGGSGPDQFVVACPLCVTMFEDGRKTGEFEDDLEVVDLAEFVRETLEERGDTARTVSID